MHFRNFSIPVFSFLVGALSFGHAVAFAEVTDDQFGKMMEKYLQTDPGKKAFDSAIEGYVQRKQSQVQKQQEEGQKTELENAFKNPAKVDAGNAPVRGPKDAKITIVEFSDFQCPFCKRGADTIKKVMEMYPKDVKLAFKQFPLPFHKDATPAARAALAANKQGKFWEMHDALFDNQQSLGDSFYEQKAKDLGLDVEKFKKDMADAEIEKAISADKDLGEKNGISGTPGFFVNGIPIKGAYPPEHFKMIIDRLLAGSGEANKKA